MSDPAANDPLPIESCRERFTTACGAGPVVVVAPTGSGKSTSIPTWCGERGPTLVVQPRRVACRALAQRVAHLTGTTLGDRVGYAVRGEQRAHAETRVLFVTPGVALRMVERLRRATHVVVDELQERTLDLDLLLALLHDHPGLVAMSATLDGRAVAGHLGATLVETSGRTFPISVEHPPGQPPLPALEGLEDRVERALAHAPTDGDVLVFLPGRAEIRSVADRLQGRWRVVPFHGGLSLEEQGRAFLTGGERRVILATNVAETSVTLPGIRVVVDTGLVRRTRYHRGRSVLTLVPVAQDAADQRAGRAGRTGPGTCLRLWSERAPLDASTPPEIYRESLVGLVLAAAATGHPDLDDLPWLDAPRDHAVQQARGELQALRALDREGRITELGHGLFGFPVDAALGRLLVEARGTAAAADTLDLVAALATSRPLFRERPTDPVDELRGAGCDAVALIRAVREGHPREHPLDPRALEEARAHRQRLAPIVGEPTAGPTVDRHALAQVILSAWPDAAHVARRHGRHVAWSNGGTELALGRDTALDPETVAFALVLDTRAVGANRLQEQRIITAAMPISAAWMLAAGLGRDRLARPILHRGVAMAEIERVYAGKVLSTRTEVPAGELAIETLRDLFLRGSLFDAATARDRLEVRALWASLHGTPPPPPLSDWVEQRFRTLGVETGEDVALLSASDLLPEDLDPWERESLARSHPRSLELPDARYRIDYHPARRLVELVKLSGARKTLPPVTWVPKLPGWRVEVVDRNVRRTLIG